MTTSGRGIGTGEWVEVDGARLFVEVAGEGAPVVLVHAGIADARMWEPQFAPLAARGRAVRYDLRGYGRSAMPPGPFSHVRDLLALLDALAIERAVLVGCSMGGKTAIDAALARPDRIAGLVLVNSALSGFGHGDDQPRQWDDLLAADAAGDLERICELEVQIWVDGPSRSPAEVDPAVRDLVYRMNLIALRTEAAGLGEEEEPPSSAIDRLGEIAAPTLVVAGALDQPWVLRAADLLVAGIPGAERAVVPDAAHLPSLERPTAFNPLLFAFLDRLGA